jgi:putative Ca2+/H+ antiporter (TMEM165/GDT1 family)
MFESFLVSTGVVALAEVGDKTQLLALVLAARYRKPVPIILGIFAAALLSHAGASFIGAVLSNLLSPAVLNWAVVASFALMAGWILVPEKLDGAEDGVSKGHAGIFVTVALSFFMAELGDKTQIATVALAAQFHSFLPVVAGTTLGMMLASVPVVLLGHRFADKLPAKAVHAVAAVMFVVLGAIALRNALAG